LLAFQQNFHLPQIAAAGVAILLLCGGTVYVLVRLRRKKSDADK